MPRDAMAYLNEKPERWERMEYMWRWMKQPDGIEEVATFACWITKMMDVQKADRAALAQRDAGDAEK